jgi:hypothetical protein
MSVRDRDFLPQLRNFYYCKMDRGGKDGDIN